MSESICCWYYIESTLECMLQKSHFCDTYVRNHLLRNLYWIHITERMLQKSHFCDIYVRKHLLRKLYWIYITKCVPEKNDLLWMVIWKYTRLHSGEKPFTCNICQKILSQNVNLKWYLIVHSSKELFLCNMSANICSEN